MQNLSNKVSVEKEAFHDGWHHLVFCSYFTLELWREKLKIKS